MLRGVASLVLVQQHPDRVTELRWGVGPQPTAPMDVRVGARTGQGNAALALRTSRQKTIRKIAQHQHQVTCIDLDMDIYSEIYMDKWQVGCRWGRERDGLPHSA
jgi:hypothetical protein